MLQFVKLINSEITEIKNIRSGLREKREHIILERNIMNGY